MIKFERVSGNVGTDVYDVTSDAVFTLKYFVEYILGKYPRRVGNFKINSIHTIRYENGALLDELPIELQLRIVSKVRVTCYYSFDYYDVELYEWWSVKDEDELKPKKKSLNDELDTFKKSLEDVYNQFQERVGCTIDSLILLRNSETGDVSVDVKLTI